jgi:hypothetical protein
MSARSLRLLRMTVLLLVGSCLLLLAACSGTSNLNGNPPISTPKPTTTSQSRQQTDSIPTPIPTPTSPGEDNTLQIKRGTLQKLEVTSFQYGTHALFDESGNILYSLRSHTVNLSAYVGKHVEVTGTLVPGYPVDGGPPYLEVSKVQEI